MKKIILLFFVVLATFSVSYGQVASYSFSQGTGTYTPLTGGTVIASYTDAATGIGRMDDQIYNLPAATIPFTFSFDGIGYDGLNVSSNGFITFGPIPPSATSYTPNSSATTYTGSIAAFGRDLEGGFVFTADRTTGSPDLVNVSNLGSAQVGDFIDGTGIPVGTTIVSIVGSTITMSANATSTGTLGACRVGGTSSNIQYGVEGTAPNRVFVIQFSNFKRFGTTLTTVQHMSLNFQIRLSETTNAINVVYGNCSPGLTTFTTVNQVGLRGPNATFATNVNNRLNVKGTSDWATSAAGTLNTSGQIFNNVAPANVIPSGLTYTWTPPTPCTGTPVAGTVAPANLNICSGTLPGNLVLSGFSSGVSGITFQWEESLDNFATAGVPAVGGTGATTSTYTPPAYSGTPIYYRAVVTCTTSGLSSTSSVTSIGNPINPTTQTTNAIISAITDVSASVNWTNGNGTRRVVVLSDSPTITDPVNGNAPALVANAVYAGTGQQIVYDGVASTVNVTGLVNGNTYYTKVYEYLRCGAGPYDYYYNVSTGTNVASFTTAAPTIPSNDDCAAPTPLTVGANFAANPLTGALYLSTNTVGLAAPTCQTSVNSDVWYTVVVPASGNVTIETQVAPLDSITDSVVIVYSGACGTLTQVGCDDDSGPTGANDFMSLLTVTGQTPGTTLYVVVRKFGTTLPSAGVSKFIVSAYDCPSTIPAPTGAAAQSFCGSGTVADLVATGTAIKWYDAPTGGNLLLSTAALVSGNVYYASQTLACESFARLAVTVTINTSAAPTFTAVAPICNGDALAALPTTSNNGITGTWSPAINNTATTTYTFTPDSGQCSTSTTTLTIVVNVRPAVTFSANPFPICAGTSSVLTANVTNVTPRISYLNLASVAQSANMNAAAFGVPVTSPLSGILALAPSNGCAAFTPGLFAGKIALIQRGTCAFAIKAQNAQDAGAIGVILYNNVAGNLIPAGSAPGVTIPVYGITQADGLALIAAMTANEVNVTLSPADALTFSWSNGSNVNTTNTGILNADTDFTVTVTNTVTGCANTIIVTVPVTPNTIPTFDAVPAICSGDALAALPTTSTNGIAGTWSPALDNTTTTTYTFTPTPVSGQCLGTTTLTITVNPVTTNGSVTTTACSSYTWPANGVTYTTSQTGLTFVTGCNTATLNLTITGNPIDYANLQFPSTQTICEGGSFTAYGRVYEAGVTDASQTLQGAGIDVEFGYDSANTDPATWTNWSAASYNSLSLCYPCNDDEYQFTTGASLTAGTYYFTFRYKRSDCTTWQYGGYPNGFWNGTSQNSGVLTVNSAPTPTGNALQTINVANANDATIASLVVNPTNVTWYGSLVDAQSETNPLPGTTVLTTGATYYAVNTVGACSSTPFAVTVTVTLGNSDFDSASFSYYPNPVKNILNLSYNQEISTVEIFNLLGQKLISNVIKANEAQVEMTNLPRGTYMVKVTSDNRVKTIKVIKE